MWTNLKGTPPPALSLGIVSAPSGRAATLCLSDHQRRLLSTLTVRTNGEPLRQDDVECGRFDAIDGAQLDEIAAFFARQLADREAAAVVLVEADRAITHPDHHDTPAGIFGWRSPAFAVLVALASRRLGIPLVLAFYEVTERESIVVHHAVDTSDMSPAFASQAQPRLLAGNVLRAMGRLLLDQEPTAEQAAAVAALVARHPGAYGYWSSTPMHPSLGDLLAFHTSHTRQTLVGASIGTIRLRMPPGPQTAEDISLEFGLAVQAHRAELGAGFAHQVALIQVCKEFGYSLRCYTDRPDVREKGATRVWPWPEEDDWAIEDLCSLRGVRATTTRA